jgi:type II restriction/modification system DNA methylase subunit YeeA
LEAISDKLNYLLNTDSVQLRDYAAAIDQLRKDVARMGQDVLVDKVAYTWFNRLMALRFMDANDYQPLQLKVISPIEGHTQPEILNEASQGRIPEELKVDRQRINDLLDGRINVANPQNEVYRMLLIASCNHLHGLFPFLFEQINDYTELLLPDLLLSELSIINDFVEGMSEEDCQHTELIGWLYQFYISEKKDEVFASKGKVKKEEIPAATQLFTPRWIVEYMVQNTVGKLWLQNNPNSSLREKMPYYIETESPQEEAYLKISSPEEITLLDQACGSGHILVYGFELLYQIYEEAGYTTSQIPALIIKNNLFGYEIDERAAQLASFSVLMKARSYYRRLFREAIQPNILCYQDLRLSNDEIKETFQELDMDLPDDLNDDLQCMQQATNYGSLIQPKTPAAELKRLEQVLKEKQSTATLFSKYQLSELHQAVKQLHQLSQKFSCIVDNPPYMGGGNMNKELSDFVKTNYPDSKADLMACFMEGGLAGLQPYGLLGMINQHSWMFLSSYEKLREKLIEQTQFDTLLHLGPRTFPEIGGEVVQNAAFTFINTQPEKQSTYIRLIDYKDSNLKSEKTLEAIQNQKCGWFYIKNQKDFKKIPGNNIGYWLSERIVICFSFESLGTKYGFVKQGISTSNQPKYERLLWEVDENRNKVKWFKFNSGGSFRRWFGNEEVVFNWENNGVELKSYPNSAIRNINFQNKRMLFWSKVTAGKFSLRETFDNQFFSGASGGILLNIEFERNYIIAFLNTKVVIKLLDAISPTLNYTEGNIASLPIRYKPNTKILVNTQTCVSISRQEWNSRETSWDFEQNELIRLNGQDTEESLDLYKAYWTKKFVELHQNEEELNRQFIEIYGLEEDLDPNVPLEDITILRDELNQRELKELSAAYQSGWTLNNGKWELPQQAMYPDLPFDSKELVIQFISYAVGLMMGRYSLDKQGLILANQGETLSDFIEKVDKPKEALSFVPDEDNIIPVLDSEWFNDDIVNQFREIVKAVWGESNLQRNIEYIERELGKPLRTYFYRDFYNDHIRRYKKRPIYWMIASPSGAFQVLIYMHRYHADTLNNVLNDYLRPYIEKLENHIEHLNHVAIEGSAREITQAKKEITNIEKTVDELRKYDKEVLYPLATNRITIDLDDGVLVNYNRFGNVVKGVPGLNDKKTKGKVKKFDWIDTKEIR